jgi:transposase
MDEELGDEQWVLIAPLLPIHQRRGRPRADDRRTLGGILWVLRSGARWKTCLLSMAVGPLVTGGSRSGKTWEFGNRYDWYTESYVAFLTIACSMLTLARILQ